MSISRRKFIVVGSTLPFAAGVPLEAKEVAKTATPVVAGAAKPKVAKPTPQIAPLTIPPGPSHLLAGPMLGHVSDTEAWIWVRATKPTTWKVQISTQPDLSGAQDIDGGALAESTGLTGGVCAKNLSASTRYYYRVWFDDRDVTALPVAFFDTAPTQGTKGHVRVAFSSCVGRLPVDSAAAFGEMAARSDFDLLLMLGDNHYGDTTDLERLRLYYTAHRKLAGYQELCARLPVYAIWDDHDYGPNNSDSTAAGKEQSLQAFREYWRNPVRQDEPEDPAIYYTFERSGVAFFMLDVRWHRSPNKMPDGPDKTMLGAKQLAWLKRELKNSKAPIKLLCSGSEWQTTGHSDSWTSFARERGELFDWLEKEKIQGVIFLSGDRHFSAGYHIRDLWPEFTAGPLGSPNERNTKAVVSPETFTLQYDGKMWMVLDIDTASSPPAVTYEIWKAGDGLIESNPLSAEVLRSEKSTMARSAQVLEILALKAAS